MRKLLLYILAAFVLTSCDNLIKSKDKDVEDTKTSKKLKKPLEDDEEDSEDETPKKKKSKNDDEDEDTKPAKSDDDDEDRTTNYSSGWSKTEKNQFMNTCISTASKRVSQSRAEEYCSCMQEKIERKYPDYNEMNSKMTSTEVNDLAAGCNQQ